MKISFIVAYPVFRDWRESKKQVLVYSPVQPRKNKEIEKL